jgi:hypothetical protein
MPVERHLVDANAVGEREVQTNRRSGGGRILGFYCVAYVSRRNPRAKAMYIRLYNREARRPPRAALTLPVRAHEAHRPMPEGIVADVAMVEHKLASARLEGGFLSKHSPRCDSVHLPTVKPDAPKLAHLVLRFRLISFGFVASAFFAISSCVCADRGLCLTWRTGSVKDLFDAAVVSTAFGANYRLAF